MSLVVLPGVWRVLPVLSHPRQLQGQKISWGSQFFKQWLVALVSFRLHLERKLLLCAFEFPDFRSKSLKTKRKIESGSKLEGMSGKNIHSAHPLWQSYRSAVLFPHSLTCNIAFSLKLLRVGTAENFSKDKNHLKFFYFSRALHFSL